MISSSSVYPEVETRKLARLNPNVSTRGHKWSTRTRAWNAGGTKYGIKGTNLSNCLEQAAIEDGTRSNCGLSDWDVFTVTSLHKFTYQWIF